MANRGLFTFLILLLGLGLLFAGGANIGYETALDDYEVTNESITVDYSESVAVNEDGPAYQHNDTVQIYNASGALLTDGTDYDWNATSAEVTWYDTTSTTDGETATISYDYQAPPETNQAMFGVIQVLGIGLTLIVILLIGQWVFEVVGDW